MTVNVESLVALQGIQSVLQKQADDFMGEPLSELLERHRVIKSGHFKMRGYCCDRHYSSGNILRYGEELEVQLLAARFLVYIEGTDVDLLVAHSDLMFQVAVRVADMIECERGDAPEVLRAIDGEKQHLLGRYGELRGKSVGILVDVVNTGETVEGIANEVERRFGSIEFVGALAYLGNYDGGLATRMFALSCDPTPIYCARGGKPCPMCRRGVPSQRYGFDAGALGDSAAVRPNRVRSEMQDEARLWALAQTLGAFESHRVMGNRHIPVYIRTGYLLADKLGHKLIVERAAHRYWHLRNRRVALVVLARRPAARALAEAMIEHGVFGRGSRVAAAAKHGDIVLLEPGFAAGCDVVLCWDVAIGTGQTALQLLAAVEAAGWSGRVQVGALLDRRPDAGGAALRAETCFRIPFRVTDVGMHESCPRCGSAEARVAMRVGMSEAGKGIHERVYAKRGFPSRKKRRGHQMMLFNDLECVLGPTLRAEACIQHYLDTGDYSEIAELLGVGNESVILKREVIARLPISLVRSGDGRRVLGGVLANSQLGDTLTRAGLKCVEGGVVDWLSSDWVRKHRGQLFGEAAWRPLVPVLEGCRHHGKRVGDVLECIRGMEDGAESEEFRQEVSAFLGVWDLVECGRRVDPVTE